MQLQSWYIPHTKLLKHRVKWLHLENTKHHHLHYSDNIDIIPMECYTKQNTISQLWKNSLQGISAQD